MFLRASRSPVALAFIFLLAGNEVHMINALRDEDALINSLAATLGEQLSEIPESDSGCMMKGMVGLGKCKPEQYCEYKKVMGGLKRSASCKLKAAFKADEVLATDLGTHAGNLLVKSEPFRAKGSLLAFYRMKKHMTAIGTCQSAMESLEPTPKKLLKSVQRAFTGKSIKEFHAFLQTKQDTSLPHLSVFNTEHFNHSVLRLNALERTVDNLDEGAKSSKLLAKAVHKVNFKALMQLQASNGEPSKEDLAEVFPEATEEQLEKAMAKAEKKERQLEQQCGADEHCLKLKRQESEGKKLEALSAKAVAKSEELTESLIQKLEARGHSVRVPGDKEATEAALMQLVEGQAGLLEGEEAEQEELTALLSGLATVLVVICLLILLSFMCGPSFLMCFLIGIVIMIVFFV